MAGRPKSSSPKVPFPVRLRDDLRAKFLVIAERERRRPAELGSLVLQDYIAAYEAANGTIATPPPPGA
jgi:hypothetical protein